MEVWFIAWRAVSAELYQKSDHPLCRRARLQIAPNIYSPADRAHGEIQPVSVEVILPLPLAVFRGDDADMVGRTFLDPRCDGSVLAFMA